MFGHVRHGVGACRFHRPICGARGAHGRTHQFRRDAPAADGGRDSRVGNGHDMTVEGVVEMRAVAVYLGGESMGALVMANGVHGPLDALRDAARVSSLPALAPALVERLAAAQPGVRSGPVRGAPDAAPPRVPAETV